MVEETQGTSARAAYLEVQNRYLGNDDKIHYSYIGGTAFAIGLMRSIQSWLGYSPNHAAGI